MSYEVEFITKAVDAVNNRGEKTVKEVANELDVPIATLNSWTRKPKAAKKTSPVAKRSRKAKIVAPVSNIGLNLNSLPENVRIFIGNLLLENFELRSKVS